MAPRTEADAADHEPILYSGDPIQGGGHDGGVHRPATTPRLRGLPIVFLSHGAQVYAGGAPFTDRTTLDDLANRDEVRSVERRAAQRNEPLPDAFVFFNEARTEVKVLLWSDRGFSVVHQRLDAGTFGFSRNVAPGELLAVVELGELLRGPARLGPVVQATHAAAPPPSVH